MKGNKGTKHEILKHTTGLETEGIFTVSPNLKGQREHSYPALETVSAMRLKLQGLWPQVQAHRHCPPAAVTRGAWKSAPWPHPAPVLLPSCRASLCLNPVRSQSASASEPAHARQKGQPPGVWRVRRRKKSRRVVVSGHSMGSGYDTHSERNLQEKQEMFDVWI